MLQLRLLRLFSSENNVLENAINPTYIIAEMSGNHNGDYSRAVDIIHAAKDSGADAVKIQTYTADTITIDCDNKYFQIEGGTIWDGTTLYKLYQEAATPWEWQPKLKEIADSIGIDFFSTPFDNTSVDFLEQMNVCIYKIASFELIDIPLLERVAATGKPVIMSTGMASVDEIQEAIDTLRSNGCPDVSLLKCTSMYPAEPENMNLLTIPDMITRFKCPVGLSDHSLALAVPITAVALGASIVEKHICLSRKDGGVDSKFSLEPTEFKEMSVAIRTAEKAMGNVSYELTPDEENSLKFRKSLWVAEDIKAGEQFTHTNIRSIRPGQGLHPRYLSQIIGKVSNVALSKGTPLASEFFDGVLS